MGFALAGLSVGTNEGIQNSIIYLIIYLLMNIAFFCCLFMLKRENQYFDKVEDLSGLSKNHPLLSLSMMIILFSLAGIPPLAGFFAKFYIFTAVIEQSMYFLAIVGLLSTVIAAFYYIRLIKVMYFDEQREKYDLNHSIGLKMILVVSSTIILIYFVNPNIINNFVSNITII